MSAGALLAESIRVAVSGLRAIATALEQALSRFDRLQNEPGLAVDLEGAGASASPPVSSPLPVSDWGLVTSAAVSEPPANTPPLVGLGPVSVPAQSIAGTDFSTESYHRVASSPLTCVSVLEGPRKASNFVLVELGKLVCGLVLLFKVWFQSLVLRPSLRGSRTLCTSLFVLLLCLPPLGWIPLLSSSGSSHPLPAQIQSPTPLPLSLRHVSTAQGLELP